MLFEWLIESSAFHNDSAISCMSRVLVAVKETTYAT